MTAVRARMNPALNRLLLDMKPSLTRLMDEDRISGVHLKKSRKKTAWWNPFKHCLTGLHNTYRLLKRSTRCFKHPLWWCLNSLSKSLARLKKGEIIITPPLIYLFFSLRSIYNNRIGGNKEEKRKIHNRKLCSLTVNNFNLSRKRLFSCSSERYIVAAVRVYL